jgi:hypothetical protein
MHDGKENVQPSLAVPMEGVSEPAGKDDDGSSGQRRANTSTAAPAAIVVSSGPRFIVGVKRCSNIHVVAAASFSFSFRHGLV